MGILSRILGYMTREERVGISLGRDATWQVWGVGDPQKFFLALRALVPPESVLALHEPEGKNVRQFLREHAAETHTRVEAGTIWPRPEIYHIDCSAPNLTALEDLASRHAAPEMAIHLHVYRKEQVLIESYDAFDDPMHLSGVFRVEDVMRFSESCGDGHERIQT